MTEQEVKPQEEVSTVELTAKAKEIVKQFDGLARHEAMYVVSCLQREIELNSKVSISPTC